MGLGLEKEPGHGRAEGQRVDGREEEREDDRQRKLIIEPAGKPRNECHGHEDRRQDECDGDDRRGDLGHGGAGGFERLVTAFEVLLHVLDHDDRVVHHQADRQHQAHQRERVDREAESGHQPERGDQRDRDRDHGNQRGAQALQEDEHDDQHQAKSLEQGMFHLIDVLADIASGIEGDAVLDIGREVAGQPVHLGPDRGDNGQRIGVGVLVNGDGGRGLAAEIASLLVGLRAELDPGDVAQEDLRAVGSGPDDDLLKFGHDREPALGGDGEFEPLARGHGWSAYLAGGGLAILGLDGVDDLVRRDLLIGHPVRVEPDPHGVLAAEDVDIADPPDSLEDVNDVDLDVIVEEVRVVRAAGTHQVDHADHVGGGLLALDADLGHLGRKHGFGGINLVLDVDGADVLRITDVESDQDARDSVARAIRRHVDHAVDAVDLLLDRGGHRVGDGLGVGAGVGCGDLDLGRDDVGIERQRQQTHADTADE